MYLSGECCDTSGILKALPHCLWENSRCGGEGHNIVLEHGKKDGWLGQGASRLTKYVIAQNVNIDDLEKGNIFS